MAKGAELNHQAAEAGHEIALLTAITRDFFNYPDKKEKAIDKTKELANNGDPFAQFRIAVCCETGHMMTMDDSFEWFKKAAEQGFFPAFFKLARHYYDGRAVTQDYSQAAKWYERSAPYETSACWNLGLMLQVGKPGCDKNLETAFKWFLEGAKGGHVNCMAQAATCYLDGEGVPENPEKALEYFRMASSKKHSKATYQLGILYEKGIAVEQDWAKALELYSSASQDMKVAIESKKELQKKILKAQQKTVTPSTSSTATTITSTSNSSIQPSSIAAASKPSYKSIDNLLELLNMIHLLPTLKKEEIDIEALSILSVRDLHAIGVKMGEAAKILKAVDANSLQQLVHISGPVTYCNHGHTVTTLPTPTLRESAKHLIDLSSSGALTEQARKSRENYKYDIFLSHKQANGADLAQSIKLQLLDRDPSLRIFLDVDDLNNVHNLEQLVAETQHFVLLITEGVLERPYVKLEIKMALKLNKHIILIHGTSKMKRIAKSTDERSCQFPIQRDCDPEIQAVLLPLAIPYYRAKAFRDTSINLLFTHISSYTEENK